jgi:hypothetical protein
MDAGYGGVVRGSNGQWIVDFNKRIGRCNLYIYSGIWGVLEGLKDGSRDGVYEDEIVCGMWI